MKLRSLLLMVWLATGPALAACPRIVSLKGENFFHPGPSPMQGYRELSASLKS